MTETTPSAAAERRAGRLEGALGVPSIVFMVIAAAAPITVIGGNVPIAIGSGNGAGAPAGFVIATVVLLVFAIGFVSMTPYVHEAGAFFSYVTTGLGSRAGLGTAFVALVAYTAIQVGIYGYFGWALDDIVQYFGGPHVYWGFYALGVLVIVALLGYRHIELSSKVLGIALVLEIAVVVIVDVVIFATGGKEGLAVESFAPSNVFTPGLGVAVLFALTGFIGFESTAVFRDEARSPERTIPRATYIAVILIGVVYTASCWALITGTGASHAVAVAEKTLGGSGNMLPDLAGQYAGPVVQDAIQVLMCTSLFACLLSFHNVIARYQFTLAGKGVFPAALGVINRRHGSPATSSLVQTATALVLVGGFAAFRVEPLVGVFGSMAGVATVGMVLLMLTTSIAVLVFFSRNRTLQRAQRGRTVIAPILAVIGLALSLWLVLTNFKLVTGGSTALSIALALVPVAALVLGIALGRRYRVGQMAAPNTALLETIRGEAHDEAPAGELLGRHPEPSVPADGDIVQ